MSKASPTENVRKNNRKKIREALSMPKFRGKVVHIGELCAELRKSRSWFDKYDIKLVMAQEWLSINQDAPLDAKVHYQGILNSELGKLRSEVKVVSTTRSGNKKEFFVPREEARKKTVQIAKILGKNSDSTVKSEETTTSTALVPVSESDLKIERIRNAYVMAPLGDIPNIKNLMQDLALLDEKGHPVDPAVTEELVRKKMNTEDWREMRSAHLHDTIDLIPEELKLITMVRNVEVHKILFNEIKIMHRNHMSYYQKGSVRSLDGLTNLNAEPDPATLASLAEVMRRMIEGGGNINILIGQIGNRMNIGGQGKDAGIIGLSLLNKQYIGQLSEMSQDTLKSEIDRLEQLKVLLETTPDCNVTHNEDDIIEVEFSDPKSAPQLPPKKE